MKYGGLMFHKQPNGCLTRWEASFGPFTLLLYECGADVWVVAFRGERWIGDVRFDRGWLGDQALRSRVGL